MHRDKNPEVSRIGNRGLYKYVDMWSRKFFKVTLAISYFIVASLSSHWLGMHVLFIFYFAEETCSNINHQIGTCIPLRNCTHLYERLSTTPLTNDVRTFLARSKCAPFVRPPIFIHLNSVQKKTWLILSCECLRCVARRIHPHQHLRQQRTQIMGVMA